MQQIHNKHDRHIMPCPCHLSSLPLVELEITCGRARNKRRRIRAATYLFGAGAECDLVLGDPQFEEVHGYLLLRPQGVMLRHLGFRPELTVNGRPVRNILLPDKARIRTGPFEFRIHIRPNPAAGSDLCGDGYVAEPVEPDMAPVGAELSGAAAGLRLFPGAEDRRQPGQHGGKLSGFEPITIPRPPKWRHYSELILSP